MKNSIRILTCLSIFALAACNNGGGGSGGGPNAQQFIPGITPDGQKVAPLPADKKDQALAEMATMSVSQKVFFRQLGLAGSNTPNGLNGSIARNSGTAAAVNPKDLERTIENGILGNCRVTPIDMTKGKPDAAGNVNFTTDGKIEGPTCPFSASAKYSMVGTSKGDANASSSVMRVELNVGMTVQDAAMTSRMDGIQGANIAGFIALNMSGRKTGERSYTMDNAMNFDLSGSVDSLKGRSTVRMYGTATGQSIYADQQMTEIMNSKNSSMIVAPGIGTIVFDVIVTTVPGQTPVTKYYLNGEEVGPEIGQQFQSDLSESPLKRQPN